MSEITKPTPTLDADGKLHTETMEEKFIKAIKDSEEAKIAFIQKALDERDKRIDNKLAELIAERDDVLIKAARKGLGADVDPVIHMSDIPSILRKAQLENSEVAKKTPAPIEKAGPEGTMPKSPFETMLKPFEEVKA